MNELPSEQRLRAYLIGLLGPTATIDKILERVVKVKEEEREVCAQLAESALDNHSLMIDRSGSTGAAASHYIAELIMEMITKHLKDRGIVKTITKKKRSNP